MIDRATGNIKIDKKLIKPNDPKENISLLDLAEYREEQDMKNGWTWLTEKNILADNKYFILSFGLFKNKLRMVRIVFQDNKFDLANDWNSWSETDELEKLNKFKTWLNHELGSQETFEWGNAIAYYDSKGQSSYIILEYK
jgi:hypothetical protein